jgi:tetrahydromethanopterin S-methyltransferase subunit A
MSRKTPAVNLGCEITGRSYSEPWPPVRGDFTVVDPEGRVAVVTLAGQMKVNDAAIYGPCKTENLGVEKIVANMISNSNLRYLLVCGPESKGHLPGDAIMSLHKNGIDEKGRIVGSRGAIPFIQNLSPDAIRRFQEQIEVIDRIGLEDREEIEGLVRFYSLLAEPYSEEPFVVCKRRVKSSPVAEGEGDLYLGGGVVMNTSAWLVKGGVVPVQV